MTLLEKYKSAAYTMGITLPSDLIRAVSLSECLQTLSDEGMDLFWDPPHPISEMCDLVFPSGPLGESDRILLIAGEPEGPVGLDYRFSSDNPGIIVWDGSSIEHQGISMTSWLYGQVDTVQEWIDNENYCQSDESRQAAEHLKIFLQGFQSAAEQDDQNNSSCRSEEAVGERICSHTYECWSKSFPAVPVVGLAHSAYPSIKDLIKIGTIVRLVHEPDNQYDRRAIAVVVDIAGIGTRKIGYVPKGENADIAYQMSYGFLPVGEITAIQEKWLTMKLSHAKPADETVGTVYIFPNNDAYWKLLP